MKKTRLTKSILLAAAALAFTAPASKAYTVGNWNETSDYWYYHHPDAPYLTGGGDWTAETILRTSQLFGSRTQHLAAAGLYDVRGRIVWSNNVYPLGGSITDYAYASFSIGGLMRDDVAYEAIIGGGDARNWYSTWELLPIDNLNLTLGWVLLGDDGTDLYRGYYLQERNVQVARTGTGVFGDSATSAFALDNSNTTAAQSVFSVPTGSVRGSVVRTGNIDLGISGQEGLYVKDAGWLDVKGNVRLYSNSMTYIRDGELTSNIFRNNAQDEYGATPNLVWDSGIISVRGSFAHEMYANEGQTLGFRDGAANATELYVTGGGYFQHSDYFGGTDHSFDYTDLTAWAEGAYLGGGAVRSITGNNTQNGDISIGAYEAAYSDVDARYPLADGGEGYTKLSYARINSDKLDATASVFTINGNINAVNNVSSNGGALLMMGGAGKTIVNGTIAAGINDLYKDGSGSVVLNSANSYTGDTLVTQGSLFVSHAGALSTSKVYATWGESVVENYTNGGNYTWGNSEGGSVVLDLAAGMTLSNDFVISGNGSDLSGAALVNRTGANRISGDVRVGLSKYSYVLYPLSDRAGLEHWDDAGRIDGSIKVLGDSSLTIDGDLGSDVPDLGLYTNTFNRFGLTINTTAANAAGATGGTVTAGVLTVTGSTQELTDITKDGAGDAIIAGVSGALTNVTVNAGKLVLVDQETHGNTNAFAELNKYGAGTLVLTGGEGSTYLGTALTSAGGVYYDDLNLYAGTTEIRGQASVISPLGESLDVVGGEGAVTKLDVYGRLNANVGGEGGDIHLSTYSGIGGLDNTSGAQLNVKWIDGSNHGVVDLGLGRVIADGYSTINVAGTVQNGASVDGITLNDYSVLNVQSHGVVNSDITLNDHTSLTISATLDGEGVVTSYGHLTGNVIANDNTFVTVNLGGRLTGDISASDSAVVTVNGAVTGDVTANTGTLLKGSGTITGNVNQNYSTVAPGNSPGTLTVTGDYHNVGGELELEISNGYGVAGTSYDQLRVGGVINVANDSVYDYSVLNFKRFGETSYMTKRGDVYQVIATATAVGPVPAGSARNTLNQFDLVEYSAQDGEDSPRVLFDHSTGKAYGTGLFLGDNIGSNASADLATRGTFRDYGVSNNQKEVGRALWMESISHDKHNGVDGGEGVGRNTLVHDQNFADYALNVTDPNDERILTGYKAFILTSNDGEGAGEQSTALGKAAVFVLTAPDAAAALDVLSPEGYAGIVEQGIRVSRGFARLSFDKRQLVAADTWDYSIGYSNESQTSSGSNGYVSYKDSSDQFNVTAARDLGKNVRLTLGVGHDDGKVAKSGFNADVSTIGFSLGLGFTPDSKTWRFDLGGSYTTSDWDAIHHGTGASDDNQGAFAVAGRLSFEPIKSGALSYAPYIGVAYSHAKVDAFSETVSLDAAALAVSELSRSSVQGELGVNFAYQLRKDLTLGVVLAWEHEFNNSGEIDMTSYFIDDGVTDTEFSIKSRGFGSDQFRAGLSLRYDIGARSAVTFGYDAVMGSQVDSGSKFRVDYAFRF